jgi:hypothetical protein
MKSLNAKMCPEIGCVNKPLYSPLLNVVYINSGKIQILMNELLKVSLSTIKKNV